MKHVENYSAPSGTSPLCHGENTGDQDLLKTGRENSLQFCKRGVEKFFLKTYIWLHYSPSISKSNGKRWNYNYWKQEVWYQISSYIWLTPSSIPRILFPRSSTLPPISCRVSLGLSWLLVCKGVKLAISEQSTVKKTPPSLPAISE